MSVPRSCGERSNGYAKRLSANDRWTFVGERSAMNVRWSFVGRSLLVRSSLHATATLPPQA